ncbi:G-D-S-L family lipolytic protein [Flavobacterium sp. F372]|uniref:G-D-S-L family lipolytic protein n=1 Tax=Flavobacterium bernardetii TaxID=2813823 RepID=A0ABR7J190_9FLAO|nr:G-D-S-L family lipolytic protein [Flavobacterium bernardetii]MBC5835713.1 G-D-S-L family lipolytic protein [Flavobacterium bernardetii]NHF69444.1 G-D-S-L family lipolytic protein [Flavobacterium bernardetii]
MKNKFILLATLVIGFTSCEPEFENEVTANYSSGDADFSSYVAVGNSLTAGYMDGTVSKGSQMNSYPNLLAQQFSLVGGGAFTQPSYADDVNNLGGLTLGGLPIGSTRLVIDASQSRPEPIAGTSTIEVSNLQAKAYNNMGVPGAKSFHLLAPGYGNLAGVALGQANPYFVRHATTSGATVLGDAMIKAPTFFTNWIGANDVLAYATNGGAQSNGTSAADDHNSTGNMNPQSYGGNDITNSTAYASVYGTIINTLTSNGAKGVVCTIPSVTSIPYFTTVPYAPLTAQGIGKGLLPSTATTAQQIAAGTAVMTQLNADLYSKLDAVFTFYGEADRVNQLNASIANPILINDVDAADRTAQISGALQLQGYSAANANEIGAAFGKSRQTTAADLVVLPASSVVGTPNAIAAANPVLAGMNAVVNGVSYPMANKWVLTANEKAKVASATSAFNASIVSIANAKNTAAGKTVIAVADMNAIMTQLVSGIKSGDGSFYTANYFSGSSTEGSVLFSLDGVHPNARGYAVISNEIIKVINRDFKANLPFHNPSYFPGINIVPSN